MPVSTVRGADLGHQTSGDGPTLIWGHGLTMSREAENAQPMIDWAEVPTCVTRYDARGHGVSTSTPDVSAYGWEDLARDQLGLADSLGIDRYIAAGASMGCATALHAAVLAPGRVRAVIAVIPPTAWETRAAQTDQYAAAAHVVATRGVEPMIIAQRDIAPPDPYVGDEQRRTIREAALRAWDTERLARVFLGATTANLPARESIATIAVPTLILAWTGDPAHPRSTAEELAGLIDGATLHLATTRAELDSWTARVAEFAEAIR